MSLFCPKPRAANAQIASVCSLRSGGVHCARFCTTGVGILLLCPASRVKYNGPLCVSVFKRRVVKAYSGAPALCRAAFQMCFALSALLVQN